MNILANGGADQPVTILGLLLCLAGGLAGGAAHGFLVAVVEARRERSRRKAAETRCVELGETLHRARSREDYLQVEVEVLALLHESVDFTHHWSARAEWGRRRTALKTLRAAFTALRGAEKSDVGRVLAQVKACADELCPLKEVVQIPDAFNNLGRESGALGK